jgi:hypothetical protein
LSETVCGTGRSEKRGKVLLMSRYTHEVGSAVCGLRKSAPRFAENNLRLFPPAFKADAPTMLLVCFYNCLTLVWRRLKYAWLSEWSVLSQELLVPSDLPFTYIRVNIKPPLSVDRNAFPRFLDLCPIQLGIHNCLFLLSLYYHLRIRIDNH